MIESAHDKVLTWCRRSNGIVMRSADGRCNLWDNSYIEPEMVFSGDTWEQVWDEWCSKRPIEPKPEPAPERPIASRNRRYWRRR